MNSGAWLAAVELISQHTIRFHRQGHSQHPVRTVNLCLPKRRLAEQGGLDTPGALWGGGGPGTPPPSPWAPPPPPPVTIFGPFREIPNQAEADAEPGKERLLVATPVPRECQITTSVVQGPPKPPPPPNYKAHPVLYLVEISRSLGGGLYIWGV